jgi:hypothetical protein
MGARRWQPVLAALPRACFEGSIEHNNRLTHRSTGFQE